MRKFMLFLIIIFMAFFKIAFTQTINIHLNDGTIQEFNLSSIDSITFKITGGSFIIQIDSSFISTNISDYTNIKGDWLIENNAMIQNSTTTSPPDDDIFYNNYSGMYYSVSADITVIGDNGGNYSMGILGKVLDQNNFYYVYLGQSGEIALAKVINGNWNLIHSQTFNPLPINTTINLKIDFAQSGISVFTDDTLRYSIPIQTTEFDYGTFGFTTGWGAAGKFENLIILNH